MADPILARDAETLEVRGSALMFALLAMATISTIVATLRKCLSEREHWPTKRILRIIPAEKGSGRHDVSQMHDRHIAEQ